MQEQCDDHPGIRDEFINAADNDLTFSERLLQLTKHGVSWMIIKVNDMLKSPPLPRAMNFQKDHLKGKIMMEFYSCRGGWQGIVHHEFIPDGAMSARKSTSKSSSFNRS
jgi:hypothetical protein